VTSTFYRWSLASGKRLITADGQEVHFSLGKRAEGKFEASWTMHGGHMIKIVAHAAPALFYSPDFRQFDLLLDGCSFFDMPKIFELGTSNAVPSGVVPSYQIESEQNQFSLTPFSNQRSQTWQHDQHQLQSYLPNVDSSREPHTNQRGQKSVLDSTASNSSVREPIPERDLLVLDDFDTIGQNSRLSFAVNNSSPFLPSPTGFAHSPSNTNAPHKYIPYLFQQAVNDSYLSQSTHSLVQMPHSPHAENAGMIVVYGSENQNVSAFVSSVSHFQPPTQCDAQQQMMVHWHPHQQYIKAVAY
jgi:hypothetical protein